MKLLKILYLIFLLCLLFSDISKAQTKDLSKIADSITNEAQVLFKSEWASWYGSDIFSEKCKTRRPLSGGYISYDTGTGLNNVFFSKGPDPKILATISFGYDFNNDNYKLDTADRKFTSLEKDLYTIRQTVYADIKTDTLYKNYNNSSLNAIPIITNKVRRVYVLTGPNINGVVIFGNDYLITFDDNNKLISKRKIHKSIIPVNYSKPGTDAVNVQLATMHTHLPETGEFITATDICTLMLYEKFTSWANCIVISRNYVSSWDCKKNKLLILTQEAWKKISADRNTLKN